MSTDGYYFQISLQHFFRPPFCNNDYFRIRKILRFRKKGIEKGRNTTWLVNRTSPVKMQPVFLFRNAFRYLSLRRLIVSSLLIFSACHLRYTPIDYSVVVRNFRTLVIVHYIADNIKQNTVVFRGKNMNLCDINMITRNIGIIRQ